MSRSYIELARSLMVSTWALVATGSHPLLVLRFLCAQGQDLRILSLVGFTH